MRWFARNILPGIIIIIFCALYIIYEYDLYPAKINNAAEKKFYVINLERNKDRLAYTKKQTDKFGIQLNRFNATDGYNILLEDIRSNEKITGRELAEGEKFLILDNRYRVFCDPGLNKQHDYIYSTRSIGAGDVYNYILSAGEMGLVCSSRRLWREIAESEDEQIAVIFEDDVKLYDDFDKNIQHIFSNLPDRWDLVYVDSRLVEPVSGELKIENDYLFKVVPQITTACAHAYMINKNSAKILLSTYDRVTNLAVDQFFASLIKANRLGAFLAREKIAGVRNIPSELDKMGRISPESDLFKKLKEQ